LKFLREIIWKLFIIIFKGEIKEEIESLKNLVLSLSKNDRYTALELIQNSKKLTFETPKCYVKRLKKEIMEACN
jgi:hypothetical protein